MRARRVFALLLAALSRPLCSFSVPLRDVGYNSIVKDVLPSLSDTVVLFHDTRLPTDGATVATVRALAESFDGPGSFGFVACDVSLPDNAAAHTALGVRNLGAAEIFVVTAASGVRRYTHALGDGGATLRHFLEIQALPASEQSVRRWKAGMKKELEELVDSGKTLFTLFVRSDCAACDRATATFRRAATYLAQQEPYSDVVWLRLECQPEDSSASYDAEQAEFCDTFKVASGTKAVDQYPTLILSHGERDTIYRHSVRDVFTLQDFLDRALAPITPPLLTDTPHPRHHLRPPPPSERTGSSQRRPSKQRGRRRQPPATETAAAAAAAGQDGAEDDGDLAAALVEMESEVEAAKAEIARLKAELDAAHQRQLKGDETSSDSCDVSSDDSP